MNEYEKGMRCLVTRSGKQTWVLVKEMTLEELQQAYERALRHARAGIISPAQVRLGDELVLRGVNFKAALC
jgi:hypothetical protein